MTIINTAWFADQSPGRGKIVTITPTASLIGAGGKYYFEVQNVQSQNEEQICIGIAGATFQISYPWRLDVAGNGTTLANGNFCSIGNGNNTLFGAGRAYPTNPFNGTLTAVSGVGADRIGVAVDTINGNIWWRDANNNWAGSSTSGVLTTAQVVAGTSPQTFNAGTLGPISGNIFILCGGGFNGDAGHAFGILNTGASAFTQTPPTGYVAWDTTALSILNPSDKAAEIILTQNNMKFEVGVITDHANQNTVFVRSNTSKLRV